MSTPQAISSKRLTLPSAIGEPMVWLTGGALVVCLAMIVVLITMVVVNGAMTFWPRAIERVTLNDGGVILGIAIEHQAQTDTTASRTLYRVGNRDIGQESFRWVDDADVQSIETPPDAVMLERLAWGVWFGVPESIERVVDDGERTVVAQGSEAFFAAFEGIHRDARAERARGARLKKFELGKINHEIERQRLTLKQMEIEVARGSDGLLWLGWTVWIGLGVGVLVLIGLAYRLRDFGTELGSTHARRGQLIRRSTWTLAGFLLVAMWIAGPWKSSIAGEQELEALRAEVSLRVEDLQKNYDEVLSNVRAIEDEDALDRIVVIEQTSGRFAPISQTLSDEPMLASQVVRMVRANTLTTRGKLGVFFSRWWEYLSTFPREANTEGGVLPVIVGTVLLTLMLTIFVTPMGVIAALYLREYAKQGFITSLIRIAVNNLAGVPSIVYGVFGLGFFCYTVGRYVDVGPTGLSRMAAASWWWVYTLVGVGALIGFGCRLWSKPDPGKEPSLRHVLIGRLSWLVWSVVFVLAILLVIRTPYFHGFFEARQAEGSPTFGARGMLWASLTLALLTLPVVIVATEEAIAAVPNSMRQGSYGCGASKWQTMRRIVLPGALPGILTGAILAMARGAGEVAPLMLVGAVKLNQDLPISTQYPYLHADRSFMHLGFHIYDLGFQSPDSQAARPLVWTTTLLFLAIVFSLNLAAIMIRSRLRAKMMGPTV
jgi:phosphate transport system permease protein